MISADQLDKTYGSRKYEMRYVLDRQHMPRYVRAYECKQDDAFWIPELGFSLHISGVYRDEKSAIEASTIALVSEARTLNARLNEINSILILRRPGWLFHNE